MGKNLPAKEAALFKSVLKFYEYKQYKKGLKAAEQILRKFPEHGESLALKGLILECLGRKEEALDYIRHGLRSNLQSHICWHVYGLYHRSNKHYEEAVKCYLNALKHDKDNLQILRDLALLQIQLRDLEGFNETRHHLLIIRPQNRASWIGLAISYHLLHDHDMALKVLDAYGDTLARRPEDDPVDFEISEMLLYKNTMLVECGRSEEALRHLMRIEQEVCDKRSWKEQQGQVLLSMHHFSEAEAVYRQLLHENPEHQGYYTALQACTRGGGDGLSLEETERRVHLLEELKREYPRAHAPRRLLLDLLQGHAFDQAAEEYLIAGLRKGVPSLFVMLRSLYKEPAKVKSLAEIAHRAVGTLKAEPKTGDEASPHAWALVYVAQHCDLVHDGPMALACIDEAVQAAPRVPEMHMIKAKLLKHAGNLPLAMESMNKARALDPADRYLNTKCTKYMLRNRELAQAETTSALFAKGEHGDNNLVEMQCIWFALEAGHLHWRNKDYGQALKKLHLVDKYYSDFIDDQFDFHTYCLRKMTLRSYIKLLAFEDTIKGHVYYKRAATAAIQIYLELHDQPKNDGKSRPEDDPDAVSEAERKKLVSKQRRAEARSKPSESEATAAVSAQRPSAEPQKKKKAVDEDPLGKRFLEITDYLAAALPFLKSLELHANGDPDTHWLAAEVYRRKGLHLLTLRSLRRGLQLDPNDAKLHKSAMLYCTAHGDRVEDHPVVQELMQELRKDIFPACDVQSMNDEFWSRNRFSPMHVLAAAAVVKRTAPESTEKAVQWLLAADSEHASIQDCIKLHQALEKDFKDADAAQRFFATCQRRFPMATYFA